MASWFPLSVMSGSRWHSRIPAPQLMRRRRAPFLTSKRAKDCSLKTVSQVSHADPVCWTCQSQNCSTEHFCWLAKNGVAASAAGNEGHAELRGTPEEPAPLLAWRRDVACTGERKMWNGNIEKRYRMAGNGMEKEDQIQGKDDGCCSESWRYFRPA